MQYIYVIFAYLLGSIPFGLLMSNYFGNGRLREQGSKNIGATNVLRTQGKWLGAITLILDFLKGFCASYCLVTDSWIINLLIIAAPVIGHIFPVWLKFKGGKGVATYFGVLCAICPLAFLGTIAIWLLLFYITKISSIAALFSTISSLLLFSFIQNFFILSYINELYVLIILVLIIIAKHSENIKRLLENQELRT